MYLYKEYYASSFGQKIGFKPAYGGTGLGKTKGILELLKDPKLREGKKFVYLTNRHNLLKEFADDLEAGGVGFAYLYADPEIIHNLIEKSEFEEILEELVNKNFFRAIKSPSKLKQELFRKASLLQELSHGSNKGTSTAIKQSLTEQANKQAKDIFASLRRSFQMLRKDFPNIHRSLCKDPQLGKLFPYLQFQNDPNTPVLLATVQKTMYGFFDGEQIRKLPFLKDNIIFLDEFDFLENELLQILCKQPMLANPFGFIRLFQDGFSNWAKEPFWELEETKYFKDRFQTILTTQIEKEEVAQTFNFPTTRFFRLEDDFPENEHASLFQTQETTILKPFYLSPKEHYWEVSKKFRDETMRRPWQLFRFLKQVTNDILSVFNHNRFGESVKDQIIYRLWDRLNDTQGGAYRQYIQDNYHFRYTEEVSEGELKSNIWDQDDLAYKQGYRLFRLKAENQIDTKSVELQQLELATSPEAIVQRLSEQNLVFGLSATADIPRAVRNFDFQWLKKHLPFIEPSAKDLSLITKMQSNKQERRNNKVQLTVHDFPKSSKAVQKLIESLKSKSFFSNEEIENEQIQDFRIQRLKKFFQLLEWILTKSQGDHHLIFCSTFRQIAPLFDLSIGDQDEFIAKNIKRLLNPISKGPGFSANYQGQSFNIIFLNKEKAEEIENQNFEAEHSKIQYKDLFIDPSSTRTIVVTQYATASNGVNLNAWDKKKGEQIDFQGIHLLEKQEFWFEKKNESQTELSPERQLVWYLWKLRHQGSLFDAKFKHWVDQLDMQEVNNQYKSHHSEMRADYIRNSVALFYQALGRVDRKWELSPLTEVSFDAEILQIFSSYLEMDVELVESRKAFTANFMLNLHELIQQAAKEKLLEQSYTPYEDVRPANEKSKEAISFLLGKIESLKAGELNQEEASEVRNCWEGIRHAILAQDFNKEFQLPGSDRKHSIRDIFTYPSIYAGKRYINIDTLQVYNKRLYGRKTREWNPSVVYRHISKNEGIRHGFQLQNWRLSFPGNATRYWTPFIQQAILQGAIGEEAIKIILKAQGMSLETPDKIPDSLYELFDMKLENLPIYIDSKYYSPQTLEKFSLKPEDYGYDWELDAEEFLKKCIAKIKLIRKVTASDKAQLVIMNLAGSAIAKLSHFNLYGKPVKTEDPTKAITIVPGVIVRDRPNLLSKCFQSWTSNIQTQYTHV